MKIQQYKNTNKFFLYKNTMMVLQGKTGLDLACEPSPKIQK